MGMAPARNSKRTRRVKPKAAPATASRRDDRSDAELIQACLAKDEQAWGVLLQRYAGLIYSVALRRGLSHDLADDVFQSVAITMAERLHLLKNPVTLPKWLMVTTARRAIAMVRRHERANEPPAPPTPVESANSEEILLRQELDVLVDQALRELPPRDRDLLRDFFEHERSYAEIAARHGLAVGSLGMLRARALGRLRRILHRLGVA